MSDKKRADILMVEQGLAPSREKAQASIMAGTVYAGEKRINKASEMLSPEEQLTLRGTAHPFVGRGGLKLQKAITSFGADLTGRVCMDIGCATGGFTDVCLKAGASHVYAIDVGYGQFDWGLRNDPRVTLMERTNARGLTADMFDLHPTVTVMDVSFISIKLILPVAAAIMGQEGVFYTLIKPQFEAGRERVGKNGVIRDAKVHADVLREIVDFAPLIGWHVKALDFSPITGPKGNIEFLAQIVPGAAEAGETVTDEAIRALVERAHREAVKHP